MTMLKKIIRWFRWDIIWPIERFWRNMVRGWELLRLTWNNCDCDHSEATDLFLYGLRRVVNHLERHKNHVGWEYTVSRGRLIISLAEKVFGEEYELGPFERDPDESIATFMEHYRNDPELKAKISAAQVKQAKANRIFYKLLEHRLQWLWD